MATHKIRILHISDLHERVALDWMSDERKAKIRISAAGRHRVLNGVGAGSFLHEIEQFRRHEPIHLVCFTGDIADWGLKEEYQRVTRRVDDILIAAGVQRKSLFLVPGNHDIQRSLANDARIEMRALAARDSQGVSRWMAGESAPFGANPKWRLDVLLRSEAYRNWVESSLGRPELLPGEPHHPTLGWRSSLDIDGLPFPIHIVGLDSSWLAGDENDDGKLRLTQHQIDRLAFDDDGKPLPGFRLALVHHPLDVLADGAMARRLLADSVDLLLHGHQHDPIAEERGDADRNLRFIAAGSLFEGEQGDRWVNSFHLIEAQVDDQGRPRSYDIDFRGWSARGHWHPDGSLYQAARSGKLTWRIGPNLDSGFPQQNHPIAERRFVGRQAEMRMLEDALLPASGQPRTAAVCALNGMPGVGKSYLVDRFWAIHQARFPGGYVRLALDPREPSDVEALVRRLLEILAIRSGGMQEIAEALRQSKALLHIENVDAPALAHGVAALVRALSSCFVVVSGRLNGLGVSAGWAQVPIRPFDEELALAQLAEELGALPKDNGEYRTLVRNLGYLPLAIHLASGYLSAGHTPAGFMTELKHAGFKLSPVDPADPLIAEKARAIIAGTFELSMTLFESALAMEIPDAASSLAHLAQLPPSGFGANLGAAVASLDLSTFERFCVVARQLSLLESAESQVAESRRWRFHPLLAEYLRAKSDIAVALERQTQWFVARLTHPTRNANDNNPTNWREIRDEPDALNAWLEAIPGDAVPRVVGAAFNYSTQNGPFLAWRTACVRALAIDLPEFERSTVLWSYIALAHRSGDLDSALKSAQEKRGLDIKRGAERASALAAGAIADILQARGDLDEALRIRREDQLPVYERLGDVRSRAITMGKIADILQARGDLEDRRASCRERV